MSSQIAEEVSLDLVLLIKKSESDDRYKLGLVAQWLEHTLDKRGVASSTLARPTIVWGRLVAAPECEAAITRFIEADDFGKEKQMRTKRVTKKF